MIRRSVALGLVLLGLSFSEARADGHQGCFAERIGADAEVLLDEEGDHLFVPASVLKLVVSAAALEYLGPDYHAQTRVFAEGMVRDSTLRGDLVWQAGGDPTWNRRFHPDDPVAPVRALVKDVYQSGIRRVTGDLVIDLGLFPGRDFPPTRATNELAFAFAAPSSGLAIHEGAITVRIAPGSKVGAPASARFTDSDSSSIRLNNQMLTAPKARHERGTVDIQPIWGSGTLYLKGEYPISEPAYTMPLAVPDGNLHTAQEVLALLEKQGVAVEGKIRFRRLYQEDASASGATARELASWSSAPLHQWLKPILQLSHNWYADKLLRHVALKLSGEGRIYDGLEDLEEFMVETVGVREDHIDLDDGSGISPYNLISPEAITRLLVWAHGRPWADVWVRSLPRSKQGTLKAWPALPKQMAAKTGTQRHTLGLAGYRGLESAEPVAFACFLNHRLESRQVLRRELTSKILSLSTH